MPTHADGQDVPVWDRQPWDTDKSYDAFRRHYFTQPRGKRSLNAAYRKHLESNRVATVWKSGKLKDAPTHWFYWFRGWDAKGQQLPGTVFEKAIGWRDRCQAHDAMLDDQDEEEWAARRRQLRENQWQTGNELLERYKRMITSVLFRRTTESADGKTVMTLEPTDWNEGDIRRTAKMAFDFLRLSAGLSTDSVEINWQQEWTKLGVDPQRLVEQMVAAMIEQEEGSKGDSGG